MYKIIVASHGPMAEGMKKSLEFVMGPAENVTALCLDEEGISKFAERAKRLVNDQNTEEILVMVDFLFGSPFNEFSKLAAGYAGKMEIINFLLSKRSINIKIKNKVFLCFLMEFIYISFNSI